MLSLNQIRSGQKIIFRGEPYEVIEANHLKVGRGGAKLVTKLRNLLTGATIDFTFAGDEKLEEAEIRYRLSQYLYSEPGQAFFMTSDDYETIPVKLPAKQSQLLLEGSNADLIIWRGQAIGINLPKKIELKVTYTEPGFKGNTQSSTLKPAKLETGLEIQVPLFITVGDTVRVNTETGTYDARV